MTILDNARLEFHVGDDIKNVITSVTQTGISDMLSKAHAAGGNGTLSDKSLSRNVSLNDVDTSSLHAIVYREGNSDMVLTKTYNCTDTPTTTSTTVNLFTATSEGSLSIGGTKETETKGTVTLQAAYRRRTVRDYDGHTETDYGWKNDYATNGDIKFTANYDYSLTVGGLTLMSGTSSSVTTKETGSTYNSSTGWSTKWLTFTLATPKFNGTTKSFNSGDKVAAVWSLTLTSVVVDVDFPIAGGTGETYTEDGTTVEIFENYYLDIIGFQLNYSTGEFPWSYGQQAYMNNIFANGLMMSSTDKKYFAVDPDVQGSDKVLMQMQNGDNNVVKMTSNGLLFSAGSSAFFFLNPIALVVRVKYANGAYSFTELYNPRGLGIGIKSTDGGFIITHNLNHTYYTCYASHWALTANHAERDITFGTPDGVSQPVYIVEGGSAFTLVGNNDYIDVTFIDYRTF